MTGETTFVDTTVLVSAYDADAGAKTSAGAIAAPGTLAERVRADEYAGAPGVLRHGHSEAQPAAAASTAREVVATYRAWPVHRPDVYDIVAASELEDRHQLSFWDALIIVSARRSGAHSLLTEALQDGQRFGELEVVSPFRDASTGEHR